MIDFKGTCRIFLLLFFAGAMLIMCSGNEESVPSAASSLRIPDSELKNVMSKAVKGDGQAAYEVGLHFDGGCFDFENGLIWYTIGAENGHLFSMNSASILLLSPNNKDGKEAYTRGIFWVYQLAVLVDWDTEKRLQSLVDYGYTPETAKPPSDSLFPRKTLASSDIIRYQEGALQGSGQAALVLANHYSKASEAEEAEDWYRIGAQNGNAECMQQYGNILLGKTEMLDRERGKFWLARLE